MDIDLALIADAATIDAAGKLNILGVFDRINAARFPARHGRISLVLRFLATVQESGVHPVEIHLRSPGGEEVVRLDGTLQLGPGPGSAGGSAKVPHVLNLDGVVFQGPGRYSFEVKVDGEMLVTVPLTVTGPAPGAGPAPGPPSGRRPAEA